MSSKDYFLSSLSDLYYVKKNAIFKVDFSRANLLKMKIINF